VTQDSKHCYPGNRVAGMRGPKERKYEKGVRRGGENVWWLTAEGSGGSGRCSIWKVIEGSLAETATEIPSHGTRFFSEFVNCCARVPLQSYWGQPNYNKFKLKLISLPPVHANLPAFT
jgi:hypothetical protein